MGRTIILWFLLLPLSVLSSEPKPKITTLNSISDLADNNIEFGKTFPRHGLKLLYWLALNTQIDQNDVIDLENIDPSQGHYGFHHFSDYEGPIPSEPDVDYYSFGNLNVHAGSTQLPRYVTDDFYQTQYNTQYTPHRNKDRIIVQSFLNNPRRVRRVYITRHYSDPYEISPQLLREIQNIPTLGEFLRRAGYDFNSEVSFNGNKLHCNGSHWSRWRRSLPKCDTREGLKLEVEPAFEAKARITWSGIPKTILNKHLFLKVYPNMDSSTALKSYSLAQRQSGSIDTSVAQRQSGSIDTSVRLHPSLQVRLVEKTGYRSYQYTLIWSSPEFDEANKKLPTKVVGYDASLQLFVKQGKACARLYIKKSFTNCKNTFFSNSWVGFYKRSDEGHSSYETFQWATQFTENKDRHTAGYLANDYESGLDIQRGVQVRFFLDSAYTSVRARTVPWGEEARFFLSDDSSQERCQTGLRPDPYIRLSVSRAVQHSVDLSFLAFLLPCILASF